MRAEPEWGIESFEKMMRLSPLDLALALLFRFWNVQHRLSTALPIAICNLFFSEPLSSLAFV
jgi:hypothetical protein